MSDTSSVQLVGVAAHATDDPTRVAMVESDGTTLTFGDFDGHANQLAHALRERGVGPGARVGVAYRNRPAFFEAMEAVWRLRATVVPLSYRFSAAELDYFTADAKLRLLFAEDDAPTSADSSLPVVRHGEHEHITAGPPASPVVSDPAARRHRPYTSGTTGRPKAIVNAADPDGDFPMADGGLLLGLFNRTGRDEVHLCCAPVYHAQPRSFAQFALDFGQTVVLMRGFDAEDALRLIQEHRVTWTSMAPIHFARILALGPEVIARYDLSSLGLVLHSAAPCPVETKRRIMEVFPPDSVWELYGGTEGMMGMVSPQEWLKKPGTVGQRSDWTPIKILDDDGNELGPGEVGLVYVGRPTDHFAYDGDPEATDRTWRGDLFTLGEMGYLDEDGYLFLTDRQKDMIVTGGVNVYSAEVEAALAEHPAVVDVGVIGIPDDEFGEVVLALVEVGSPVDEAALIEHCRSRLADFKCPRRIELVDRLPREPTGKLRKRELRAPYWAGRERSI